MSYVHCANHRLHLVVVKALDSEDLVQRFFQQCASLYCFFSHSKVDSLYHGQKVVKLLPQRWYGHLQVTRVIFQNYKDILNVLEEIIQRSKDFDGETVVESEGFLSVIKKEIFRFVLALTKTVLEILEPADKSLQSRDVGLTACISVINATIETINNKRNDACFEEIMDSARGLSFPIVLNRQYLLRLGKKKRQCFTRRFCCHRKNIC